MGLVDVHRHTLAAPVAGGLFEDAGYDRPAMATAIAVQMILPQLVPVALNEQTTAVRAVGGVALRIVDIADVGELDSAVQGDLVGVDQTLVGSREGVHHFEVGMKRGKVYWYVRS